MEFVRNYLSRGADASTRPDASDRDTGRGCGRTVDVGSGVDGAGMIRLKGLRTPKSPGVPASAASVAFAAFVAQRAVSVVVLLSGNTETEESLMLSRNGHIRRIAVKGVLRVYRRCLWLILNLSRSTLSEVNLTVCAHYARSESITLRLMPPDGWRKRVEQLRLRFQLYVRESKVPILEVVVGRSVAGERCDN